MTDGGGGDKAPTNAPCSLKKRWRLAAEEEESPSKGSQTPTTGVRETSPISQSQEESPLSIEADQQPSVSSEKEEIKQHIKCLEPDECKEEKKKITQQCIKEIKLLLTTKERSQSTEKRKLNTVEALNAVINILKNETNPTIPHFPDQTLKTEFTDPRHVTPDATDSFIIVKYPNMVITSVSNRIPELFPEAGDSRRFENWKIKEFLNAQDYNLLVNFVTKIKCERFMADSLECSFRPALFVRFRFPDTPEPTVIQIRISQDDCSLPEDIVKLMITPLQSSPNTVFHTKHNVNLHLTHVSEQVTQCTGYLPQDLIGRPLVAFVHPQDLVILEHVHELLISTRSHPIRSTPFRFRLGSGEEAILDTEWSSYTNPWSKKVEFVVASHTVVKGPSDLHGTLRMARQTALTLQEHSSQSSRAIALHRRVANILQQPSAQCHKKHKLKPEECDGHQTLNQIEDAKSRPPIKQANSARRGNDMCSFLDQLVEAIVYGAHSPPKASGSNPEAQSPPRPLAPGHRESPTAQVVSGSPNHSNGSLSYSTINYLEKVHRLLQSQPKQHSSENSNNEKSRTNSPHNSPQDMQSRQIHAETTAVHENMPLTRELLQQHTRNWEKEYKRRYSSELACVAAAHKVAHGSANIHHPNTVDDTVKRAKIARPATDSPLWSALNLPPDPINKLVVPKPTNANTVPTGLIANVPTNQLMYPSSEFYYRALGPNPPPPPGRNFQVTVAPLPPRSSAFMSTAHNSTTNLMNKSVTNPLNLSTNPHQIHSMQKIPAIQNISPAPFSNQNNMDQLFGGFRPGEMSLSEQLILRYRGGQQQTQPPQLNVNISHEQCYISQNTPFQHDNRSAVKEATDALMLLQET